MNLLHLLTAFSLTCLTLLALKPVAARAGLVDIPGGRKNHRVPTPLVGGVGIFLGTVIVCLFVPSVLDRYGMLLAVSALVLMVGLVDDARDLRVSIRIFMHCLAAWIVLTQTGMSLTSLGDLLTVGPIDLGILAVPVTIVAVVGVINAVNMTDGVDGLSGGMLVISLSWLGGAALIGGQVPLMQLCVLLCCALLGFLLLNFRAPWKQCALVYMGDAGSTTLGFILAWLLIDASQGGSAVIAPVHALWFVAIPLMDTLYLMVKRPLQGRSPFSAGHDHLHHRLLKRGFNRQQTVLLMYLAAGATGLIGFGGLVLQISESVMFLLFAVMFVGYMAAPAFLRRQSAASSTATEHA